MSIRLQLLVVALTTLVLPWAGWRYANELEAALRGSQEQSLLAAADTIANALSAQPQRVFRNSDRHDFDARRGDLYVYPLTNQPLLDGYADDWGLPLQLVSLATINGYHARVQAGATEHYLYIYADVSDAHFDPEPNDVQPGVGKFDRVDIWLQGQDGTAENYFFATTAPGLIAAQHVVPDEDSVAHVASEPRIQAYWLQSTQGYHLEARIPLSFLGGRIWIEARDGGGKGNAGSTPSTNSEGGQLFFATDGLSELLSTFIRAGTRVMAIDNNALVLGRAGNVTAEPELSEDDRSSWYRFLLDTDTSKMPSFTSDDGHLAGDSVEAALSGDPHAQWVRGEDGRLLLTAAAPINVNGTVRGAIILEQNAEQMLELRMQAFTRLFHLTVMATATTVVVMLLFAAWMTFRIGRLRSAADSAVGNDGRIRLAMPGSGSGDEIGALARGFERLLARLNEHTQYLRTLGGKLSHELRTPLTIVRSSLDNLESDDLLEEQRSYITRAREGTQRLQTILTSLGAAARVEESIKQAERVNFDLRELISSAVAAYRDGFPNNNLAVELPEDVCFLRGAPDLIVQLLDKLIENAVDFCPPAGRIFIRLARVPGSYVLDVNNDGPRIPDEVLKHLFESLYEQRSGRDDKPHFGLGLYIVRLIAEFHGGTARAANREDGGGAAFTVTLPMI